VRENGGRLISMDSLETALYYTFSTIAQTLAAAIALLAAFVLYRLQSINSGIEDSALNVQQSYPPAQSELLIPMLMQGRYQEIFDYSEKNPVPRPPGMSVYPSEKRVALGSLLRKKTEILRTIRRSFLATVILVALSVAVLAATPWISTNQTLSVITLAVGAIWFVSCFPAFWSLIQAALA